MRRAANVDSNQAEIVKALRDAGCLVRSLAAMGQGMPDLLVGCNGVLYLVEVKDGSKPPSKRGLTPQQRDFFEEWAGYPVTVAVNPLHALTVVGAKKERLGEE